jgi:transcription elongation factor Elf1
MKAISFKCPNCDIVLLVQYVVWVNNELMLVAVCDGCDQYIRYSADKLSTSLLGGVYVPKNDKVN